MRITFLLPRCTPDNSHGRYVIGLCRALAGRHEVSVYSAGFWPGLRPLADCRSIPVLQRPLLAKIASSWAGSFTVRRGASDVVHVQGADGVVGNVVTAHFCNQAARRLVRGDRGFYTSFNYAVGSAAERYSMRRRAIRRIIAVSHRLRNDLVREYGLDPDRITVVHHGVDLNEFHPRKREMLRSAARAALGIGSAEFVVLLIGGNSRLKGFPTLLDALAMLPRDVKVLAVGLREDRGVAQLLARTTDVDRLCLHPPTNKVDELYAAADCFVLPSLYEPFGLVALEAMAMGLPVIVSQLAGVSEILSHGVDSLLLKDPTNATELASLLDSLQRDETIRLRIGAGARQTAEQHPWERVAAETLEVYQDAITES